MQTSQSCTTYRDVFQVKRLLQFTPGRNESKRVNRRSSPSVAEGIGLIHDAQNLLGALRLYADLLAVPGVLTDNTSFYADEIRQIAERSNRLIERLAIFNRMTSSPTLTRLSSLVEDSKGLMSRAARRNLEVSVDVTASGSVSVSPEIIERILLNLVKNSAAAITDSGTISILVSRADTGNSKRSGRLILTVADDGVGMSPLDVQMIRDGAFRDRDDGRGLGLRIVRELVSDSGGSLEISSSQGKGTVVSVSWPEVERLAQLPLLPAIRR